ncbi:hypothetical protein [Planobispora takensis]|uniref:DUF2306 domain-containing protein n=1 Tax=Planobispora takensis TaxID=1367882 RepID=A0A8J3WRC8_9ACTN|nr:hypothetical protein [Planobispora takensis]GIH99574.1 hypothetical protein Pta02_15830 [Planobispora takensis]
MDDILGLPIPDAGPAFLAALAVHVPAGLMGVAGGAVAMLARKGGTVHRRAGRVYRWSLTAVFASMAVMAALRWQHTAHLFAIGCLAWTAMLTGYRSRHRRPRLHILGMGLSYIALLTGFYVDNGPHLPGWDRLPAWSHWVLPTMIGVPILLRALRIGRTGKGVTR